MLHYNIYNHPNNILTFSANNIKNYSNYISSDIIECFIRWKVEYADKIIVCSKNENLIGFFRYDRGNDKRNLYEAGTYIIPEYRGQGLAFELWKRVFLLEKPKCIFGHIESVSGFNLFQKIKLNYPNVDFQFTASKEINIDKLAISA